MEIILLTIGKISKKWIKEGSEEFENRLKNYVRFRCIEIPDIKKGKGLTEAQIKESEGLKILAECGESDILTLLDEAGKEYTSVDFAGWIDKRFGSGKKRLVFVVGGPYGFSPSVYNRCDFKISLSAMTFTHEMARLFFTEQFYRAMTILNGEPYHHV